MAKRLSVYEQVQKYGGKYIDRDFGYGVMFDGERYDYIARFNSDEQIDAFVEGSGVTKSARDIVNGYLTLYFTY